MRAFERFPTWMWRNTDVDEFIRWMRGHNDGRAYETMAGFYGLDLYNLGGSIRAVIDFLDEADPGAAQAGARALRLPRAVGRATPPTYGRKAITEGYGRCEVGAVQMLKELMQRQIDCFGEECDEWLDAAANARLDQECRAILPDDVSRLGRELEFARHPHVRDALTMILDAKGPESKAIVWAHNSHIGNAAFTEMGMVRDELNIGQLVKERFGDQARLIGFGTHTGTVAAADDWDEPMEIKPVRPSLPESYEGISHDSGVERFLLDLRESDVDAAPSRRADGTAARAVHRRHLPARDRALEPLRRGDAAPAVRRLGVVR